MGGTWGRNGRTTAASTVATASMCHPPIPVTGCATCGSPDDEHRGYYYGFANEGLWPLCHAVGVAAGVPVRATSACTTAPMPGSPRPSSTKRTAPSPLVLVQDYHFALAPRMLRRQLAGEHDRRVLAHPVAAGRACSRAARGGPPSSTGCSPATSSGSRHPTTAATSSTRSRSCLDAEVDRAEGEVTFGGHTTRVRAYPVGVDWSNPDRLRRARRLPCAATASVRDLTAARGRPPRRRHGSSRLHEGHQREVPGRRAAAGARRRPVADGSCSCRSRSRAGNACRPIARARAKIVATSERINARFGSGGYRPIVLLESAPRAGGGLPALPRRRPLLRRQPSRRHEPRRQGVRLRAQRRARRAGPQPLRRRRAAAR